MLVTGIALLMILRELNLDITPILTGAGIVGLAVGFGAQSLVKDVISGFFLILENQVRVGDVAAINGTSGLVEAITLRTIVLRDGSGTVHVFPNGSITTLSNMTQGLLLLRRSTSACLRRGPRPRRPRSSRTVGAALNARTRPSRRSFSTPLEVFGVDAFTR